MKKVVRGMALTVFSAMLVLNAAYADSMVAYGASYEALAISATEFEEQTEDTKVIETEESGEDASAFDVSADAEPTGGEEQTGASTDDSSSVETPINEEAADFSSEDSSLEEASEDSEEVSEEILEETADEAALEASTGASDVLTLEEDLLDEELTDSSLLSKLHNSGYCGDKVTWEYDQNEAMLRISGTGAMYDYSLEDPAPWSRYVGYIKKVEVEEGISHIGAYFLWMQERINYKNYNYKLSSITLPKKSLTSIGEGAFGYVELEDGCTLTIPNSIKALPDKAFYGFKISQGKDDGIILPSYLKKIGNGCFENSVCSLNITLPDTVEVIGQDAFRNAYYVNELQIPASVREIKAGAFAQVHYKYTYYSMQNSVRFLGDAPTVGENAFEGLEVDVLYPSDNKTYTKEVQDRIGATFTSARWLTDEQQPGSGKAGANITYTVKHRVLTFTGTGAMYDYGSENLPVWSYMTFDSLSIDKRITSIGDYALYHVTARYVTSFPQNLSKLGKHSMECFDGELKSGQWVLNVDTIEENALYAASLYSVESGNSNLNSVQYFGDNACWNLHNDDMIVDFSKTTHIGDKAFYFAKIKGDFSKLPLVQHIGNEAFYGLEGPSDQEIVLPKSLAYLGERAFYECKWLTGKAAIDGNNLTLQKESFLRTNVKELILGGGVTRLDSAALVFGDNKANKVTFKGNRPEFVEEYGSHYSATLTCYYPASASGWEGILTEKSYFYSCYSYTNIEYIPYGDITVTFYDVTGKARTSKKLKAGDYVTEPDLGIANLPQGKPLTGWYRDPKVFSAENKWDFTQPVYMNLKLYPGAGKDTCTVRFETGCEKTLPDLEVKPGTSLKDLQSYSDKTSYPNKVIDDWYSDRFHKNRVYQSTKVTSDMTLYAKWSKEGQYLNLIYGYPDTATYRNFYEYDTYMGGVTSGRGEFKGWFLSEDFTGEPIEYLRKGELEPETYLYAKWELSDATRISVTGYMGSISYTGSAIIFPDLIVKDRDIELIKGKDYTVAYKNNVKPGDAKIIITFKGGYTGSKTINFKIKALNISSLKTAGQLTINSDVYYLNPTGRIQKPSPKLSVKLGNKTVNLRANTDYTLVYKKADPKKADYDKKAFVDPGTYTLEIQGKGSYSGTVTVPVYIQDKKSMDKVKVTVTKAAYYDGKVFHEPEIKVTDGKRVLEENVDYIRSDKKNDSLQGSFSVKAVSGADYVGKKTVTYKVSTKSIKKAVIKGFAKSLPYAGGAKVNQEIVLYKDAASARKGTDEGRLVYGTHYTVSYDKNTDAGTATITITGKYEYSGSITKSYTIAGESIKSAKVEGLANKEYTGEEIYQNGLKLFFQKNSKSEKRYLEKSMDESELMEMNDGAKKRAVDYVYTYKKNVYPGTAQIVFKGVNGYTGSFTKTFRITAKTVSEQDPHLLMSLDGKIRYTKGGSSPKPVISYNGKLLEEGTDYKLSYKNNTKVGKATVTATFKGNYKGSASKGFEIIPADIGNCTVKAKDVVYAQRKGNGKTTVSVFDTNGKQLAAGVDYDKEIEYVRNGVEIDIDKEQFESNVELKVIVSGKGNYAGTEVSGTYRIAKRDIGKVKVTMNDSARSKLYKEYTEKPVSFSPKSIRVEYTEGKTKDWLDPKYSFEIVGYRNNVKMGTATMILRGKGNYCGTKEVTFTIGKRIVK